MPVPSQGEPLSCCTWLVGLSQGLLVGRCRGWALAPPGGRVGQSEAEGLHLGGGTALWKTPSFLC